MKLTQIDLHELKQVHTKYVSLTNKFELRCDEVVRTIAKQFDKIIGWWDFNNRHDEENGHFDLSYYSNAVYISGDGQFFNGNNCVILRNEEEWNLNDSFPTQWLFEDFEEELTSGIKLYQDKIAKDKAKAHVKYLEKKEKSKLYEKANKAIRKLPLKKLKELGLV